LKQRLLCKSDPSAAVCTSSATVTTRLRGSSGLSDQATLVSSTHSAARSLEERLETLMQGWTDPTEDFHVRLSALRRELSRIYAASRPLCRLAERVARILLWEDKLKSASILAIVLYCVFTESVIQAVLAMIAYAFIAKYVPTTRPVKHLYAEEPLFARIHRVQATPLDHDGIQLPEVTESDLAWMQTQLKDIANLLERTEVLFSWRLPSKSFLALCAAIAAMPLLSCVAVEFIVKGTLLGVVLVLFILLPLQSHFPRYRRLFNPAEWLLCGIPTKTELCKVHEDTEDSCR